MLEENNSNSDNTHEIIQNQNTSKGSEIENNKTDEEAVKEIEKSVAENAEKKVAEETKIPKVDYSNYSVEDLVTSFKKLLDNNPIHLIKNHVEDIKVNFNKKFGSLLAEKKEAFLADGGNSIDFHFSSPVKTEYNKLLSSYKKQRDAYYTNLETILNQNLEKRLLAIDKLKRLIAVGNTSTMYKEFKGIQDEWKSIGSVPKIRYNDTWKIYHHHVERFYDLLHLSNSFRDIDFKNNLEEKLKIIKQAEELVLEKDINLAAKELQELHRAWKEDIGPVAKELREEIWQKFSSATKKVHDIRHEHYKAMRSRFQEIIDKKEEIIDLISAYDTSKNFSHSHWQKSISDIEKLRKQYFDAGKLPYNKSEEVWQKFKAATKKFNTAKNTFYKQEKKGQQENLKQKVALIELAESLKDSEDWETTTNAMKKVQSDWKKIGHVPRKFSDDIWKRFKSACNHYFDRYHAYKNEISKDELEIAEKKKAYLDTLNNVKKPSKELVLNAINNWKGLGRLPRNMRHLDGKFNKKIDVLLEKLSLDKNEVVMLKFTNVIDAYIANNDIRKLDSEQMFIRKKIDEVVREIQQLENNLSYFSNATIDNPLVINVKKRVKQFNDDLAIWKEKLNYLKNIDY